jgi:hypothetical protein
MLLTLLANAFSIAQTDLNLIDVEYDWFFGSNVYSVAGNPLNFKDIGSIMDSYPEPNTFYQKAVKNRKTGVPLLVVGAAGIITGIALGESNAATSPLILSSGVILTAGAIFFQSSTVNLQRSVNLYNRGVFEKANSRGSLDLGLNPLSGKLVYSF